MSQGASNSGSFAQHNELQPRLEFSHELGGIDAENRGVIEKGRNVDVLNALLDLPDERLRSSAELIRHVSLGKPGRLSMLAKQLPKNLMLWPPLSSDGVSHSCCLVFASQSKD